MYDNDENTSIISENRSNDIITTATSMQSPSIKNASSNIKLFNKSIKFINDTTNVSQIKSFSQPTYSISSYSDMKLDHILYINPYPSPNYKNLHNQLKLLKIFQKWKEFIKAQNLLRNILRY